MNIRLLPAILCLYVCFSGSYFGFAQSRKPNFIIILADDLGYGDLSCYGHPTIRTPNLDIMASEGQRFTQFYVASAVCSPSRAAILTGRLPIRTGVWGTARVFFPNSAGGLPIDEITVADLLKKGGYATGIIGKWHLGHLPQFLPTRRGFDYWFGFPYSNDMGKILSTRKDPIRPFFTEPRPKAPTLPLYKNERVIEEEPDQRLLTKRYTEEAINFIKEKKDKPFFLYYASTSPHVPLYASSEFDGKSKRGLYGDVVEELDWSVGKILQTLKDEGIDSNTLVIFTSDNGPGLGVHQHGGSAGLLAGGKTTTYEGGMRVPAIAWWPGKINPGTLSTALVTSMDLLPTFLKLSGLALPENKVLDGTDISTVLFNQEFDVRRFFYYYVNEELYAIRKGPYKAHFKTVSASYAIVDNANDPLLYNLDIDPSEKYNIGKEHPEIVSELRVEYEKQKSIIARPSEINKILPDNVPGGGADLKTLRPTWW